MPRSNARLRAGAAADGPGGGGAFVSFYREGMTAEAAAPVVSKELAGVAADFGAAAGHGGGHAHRLALSRRRRARGRDGAGGRSFAWWQPEDQPEARVTFSAQVLDGAMDKHLVIFGDEKKRRASSGRGRLPPEEAPIIAVMDEGTVHWAA